MYIYIFLINLSNNIIFTYSYLHILTYSLYFSLNKTKLPFNCMTTKSLNFETHHFEWSVCRRGHFKELDSNPITSCFELLVISKWQKIPRMSQRPSVNSYFSNFTSREAKSGSKGQTSEIHHSCCYK